MSRTKTPPISDASLAIVGTTLGNVAALIAERLRHVGQAGSFDTFGEHLHPEVARLRAEDQEALADAVAALAEESGR